MCRCVLYLYTLAIVKIHLFEQPSRLVQHEVYQQCDSLLVSSQCEIPFGEPSRYLLSSTAARCDQSRVQKSTADLEG